MVPESKLEKTEHGLVPKGEGWFVLNMRDAVWRHVDGRGAVALSAMISKASGDSNSSASIRSCSGRANRWPCTTGRPIRRTSLSSRAKQF